MKILKWTIIILLSLFLFNSIARAQSRVAIFGGVHTYDLSVNDFDEFKTGIKDADYGIHAGLKLNMDLGDIFIEPAIIFNSISAKYTIDNPDTGEVEANSLNFDIPVVLGLDLNLLNIFAGPVTHFRFANYDDLRDLGGYDDNVSRLFFGLHAGLGLNLGTVGLELRYEKNFKGPDYGAKQLLNEIKLVDVNSRIMASLVFWFGDGKDED